ncbi:hypothetical protein ACOMHN_057458 [Nucella lapillus]
MLMLRDLLDGPAKRAVGDLYYGLSESAYLNALAMLKRRFGKDYEVKKTLSCCMVSVGNNLDNYLSTLYLVVKAVFLFNNFFQFLLLSIFLQLNFWHFGVKTLQAYSATDFTQASTKTFPIVSLCHFQTLDTSQSSGYWVQCILNINIFLEKLFLIEWFWLLALLVMTIISFIVWCCKILHTQSSLRLVRRYMKLMYAYSEPLEVPAACSVEQFVLEYLRNDGIFVLRILAVNTNEVVVAQLVEELWKRYLTFEESPHSHSMDMGETSFNRDDREEKREGGPGGRGRGNMYVSRPCALLLLTVADVWPS